MIYNDHKSRTMILAYLLVQKVMNFYNSAQIEETVNQLRLIRTQIDVDRKNKHIVHQDWTKNDL